MPYDQEHACRLTDPDIYTSFARETCAAKHDGKCIDYIYGIRDGKSELQAMRYPKKIWTEADARAHCEAHKGIAFEPARKEEGAGCQNCKGGICGNKPCRKQELMYFRDEVQARPEYEEDAFGSIILKAQFVQADVTNLNGHNYPHKVVAENIIGAFKKKVVTGLDGHPDWIGGGNNPGRIGLKFFDATLGEDGWGYCRAKMIETTAGKDLQVLARENIPIGLSLRGWGHGLYDEKLDALVIQDDYELGGIDAVLDPACVGARMSREHREARVPNDNQETIDHKEVLMSKELQEQIADLTGVVTSLKDEVVALKTGGAETNTKLTQALTELDANKEAVKARDRVSAILADAEKMKGIENWAETVRKQLGGCKTVAEVDSSFEKVQSTLIDMGGKAQPAGSSIIISENRDPKKFFGKTGLPKSIPEAYNRILDRFTDSGVWDGKNRVENPRCIAKTLVDNFLKNIMAEGDAAAAAKIPDSDLMRNTRHNPLRFFLDAVGDDDTVGADVARTNSFLLPLYVISIEDLINLINQVAVTLPMDRDQGLVGFMKEYYGDGAGAWTEINKTNFDRTKGEKAEEATPQLMKVKIATNTISLQTALKFMAEWTVEAGLKMSAYWGLNIENPHLQAVKKEVMRAVSHKILYDMLTGTSCTNNDNCVSAGGNLVYPTAAPVGYSQAEWERCGITKTINRAAGLIDDVDADFVICDKTYGYLFSEPYFTKENRYSTNFGFTRAGTFNAQYGLFLTNASFMSKKIIVGYRGSAFTDAAQAFLPYVLFYLGGLVEQKNGDKSRTVQSFFAIQKIYGKRLVIVTIDGDPV